MTLRSARSSAASEALDAVPAAVDLAQQCGATRVNVLIGRELPEGSREVQLAVAVEALAECAQLAEGVEFAVLGEPIDERDMLGTRSFPAAAGLRRSSS